MELVQQPPGDGRGFRVLEYLVAVPTLVPGRGRDNVAAVTSRIETPTDLASGVAQAILGNLEVNVLTAA